MNISMINKKNSYNFQKSTLNCFNYIKITSYFLIDQFILSEIEVMSMSMSTMIPKWYVCGTGTNIVIHTD
jgi:hypothetical protein